MKFTLVMLLVMTGLAWLLLRGDPRHSEFVMLWGAVGFGFLAALTAIPLYWGARIVRRAWRDGTRAH